jgi:hypothetical protein
LVDVLKLLPPSNSIMSTMLLFDFNFAIPSIFVLSVQSWQTSILFHIKSCSERTYDNIIRTLPLYINQMTIWYKENGSLFVMMYMILLYVQVVKWWYDC